MSITLRLTLSQYHAMIARGAFDDLRDRRIELIEGELREIAAQGPWHSNTVRWLEKWSHRVLSEGAAEISVQMPISIPEFDSEPEPDLVWAKPKSYRYQHPHPDDVLLLIEIADSSLADDLTENARLYAAAGIVEYWVIDLRGSCVHVLHTPQARVYSRHKVYDRNSVIAPLAFPWLTLSINELFAD